jgi:hypothetical protein
MSKIEQVRKQIGIEKNVLFKVEGYDYRIFIFKENKIDCTDMQTKLYSYYDDEECSDEFDYVCDGDTGILLDVILYEKTICKPLNKSKPPEYEKLPTYTESKKKWYKFTPPY